MIKITSPSNQIIKEIKGLYRKKSRWENKLFLMEGIKIINEAMASDIPIKYLLFSEKFLATKEGRSFLERSKEIKGLVSLSDRIFNGLSDTDNPQGIMAVASFKERDMMEIYDLNKSFLLFLDEIQDPGNMGTIIRSGDAFNIDGIILAKGCVDPYNPKVIRATMGSIFRLPLYFCENAIDFLQDAKRQGIKIIVTSLKGKNVNKRDFSHDSLLVIGNESKGVSQGIVSLADNRVKIPMLGQAESLNAGVAASILMYEATKDRINNS